MGYTHYWDRPKKNSGSAYMFGQLALDAKKVIAQAEKEGIRIRDGQGEGEPNFNEGFFAINGDANAHTPDGRDLAHETFYWEGIPTIQEWRKDEPTYFDFCKTARKPYDAVITAILIRAKKIYGECVKVSSDGDWSEWQTGRDLYERVFNEVAECPLRQYSELS